jgi:ectoine hydroxylase-related dioxygenase (phytanoyl-CoA dioxygenase family)
MMETLKSHAVREVHQNKTEAEAHAEEIRNIGYTLITSALADCDLQLARDKIDRIYELQIREIGGEEQLRRINDANIGRGLIAYDDFFLKLAIHPQILSVTTELLGEYFILMSQNAIINHPSDEHYQVTWHRDLNYQHFVSSRPLAISALYCIDEFSDTTGGTCLLPASHKVEAFPSPEYVMNHQKTMSAPAGSILMFDAMVFHRTGANRSRGARRGVNHIYTLPLVKQQISFPKMLRGKFSDDPFLRKFLGYETETGESVQEWREAKLRQGGHLP